MIETVIFMLPRPSCRGIPAPRPVAERPAYRTLRDHIYSADVEFRPQPQPAAHMPALFRRYRKVETDSSHVRGC